MRFSVGILDALFGERVELQLPKGDGTTVTRMVSKRWLDEMERQGHISQISECEAERLGMNTQAKEQSQDKWVVRAGDLIGAAKIAAIGSNKPFCLKFPSLEQVPLEQWTFFATVAAVCSAAATIGRDVPKSNQDRVVKAIEDGVRDWDSSGLAASDDLFAFVDRSRDDGSWGDVLPTAVGMWILWNLLGRAPNDSEFPIVGALGGMFCEEFTGYWRCE